MAIRLPESVKSFLKTISGNHNNNKPEQERINQRHSEVHNTPAGQWPSSGPQPSKMGVLLYYMSLAFCIAGVLFMSKCVIAKEDDRPTILLVGATLVLNGFMFLAFSNYIYNREQKKILEYLEGKIHELMEENRGKGPRSLDS